MFQVTILDANPEVENKNILTTQATSVVLPGLEGEFEILDFHKPILSKLKKGLIVVDNLQEIPIQGGVAKMSMQNLVVMAEL